MSRARPWSSQPDKPQLMPPWEGSKSDLQAYLDQSLEYERKIVAFGKDVPKALYAGVRKIDGETMHIVSVFDRHGRNQSIFCRTQDAAQAIAALSEYAESLGIRDER